MARSERGRRRQTRYRPSSKRVAAAIGLAATLGWGVITTSGAALLRVRSPQGALRVAPWDAYARANLAVRRAGSTSTNDARAFLPIGTEARRAIARDPTIAQAWRTLGLARAIAGDERGAASLMTIAERVSRRDLPTQFWLIEAAVNRGDVAGALGHYDIAMRTRPNSVGTLIPIMVAALDTPEVRPVVARLVSLDPPWAGDFFYTLAQKPLSAGAVAALFRAMQAAGRIPAGPGVDAVITSLIARQQVGEAAAVLALIEGRRTPALRDGGFDRPGSHPPFDWQFTEEDGLTGEIREPSDRAGNAALFAGSGSAGAGVVARQLLALSPGRYRLFFSSGRTDRPAPEALEWRLSCAGSDAPLAKVPVSAQANNGGGFDVPATSCPAQWLSLYIRSGTDPQGSEAWVDDVRIAAANSPAVPSRRGAP